jgi:hypothetical protein
MLNALKRYLAQQSRNQLTEYVMDAVSSPQFIIKRPPITSNTITYSHVENWQTIFGTPPSYWDAIKDIQSSNAIQLDCNGRTINSKYTRIPFFDDVIESHFVDDYVVNIRDIDGLTAGKCLPSDFSSLDELAQNCISTLRKLPSEPLAALAKALEHKEIRLIHSVQSESVVKMAWDSRLYLQNSGGSHHFTVARYLAKSLNCDTELNFKTSYFLEAALNPKVVKTINAQYHLIAVDYLALSLIEELLEDCKGTCYRRPFRGDQGFLFAFPKNSGDMETIALALKSVGHLDIKEILDEVINLQKVHQLLGDQEHF